MPITINRKSLANGGTINGSVTINGNVTAAGTGTHIFSGSLGLAYAGTQQWHLTATTGGDLYFTRSGIADRMTLSSDGALAGMASVAVASTSAIKGVRTATGTLTNYAIAADSNASFNVTVTGAVVGDSVTVNTTDRDSFPDGFSVQAYVSAANTVTVRMVNVSSSSKNTGTGTYRVTVFSF